ncbi:MAG TPA: AGE family epimerase/isomerase, partial [Fimbriimonadaceae bacterium]|nr:AGE family epimerase/isomerase [Fimbriimonadaceae bacterium]
MLACLPVLLFAIMESPPSPRTAYLHLADAVEANFREHVLGRWYPRSVDPGGHGFRQNYNEDWSPGEPSERSIVYQSRLTWVAAMAAMRYPKERSSYLRYARAGVKELGRFWDTRDGGFYWAGTASGFPDRDKHVYGIAYAIYASATAYRATHDPGDLALAERGFRWLETHAHDPAHGGYYEALDPEGNPILGPDDTYRMDWPHRAGTDQIGTVFGLKSMNTHIHLLEALTALQEVWPDKLVRQRLAEVFGIVRDKVAAPGGYLHMFFKPDWTPVGDEDSYGHDIETAYLLVEGAAALGKSGDAKTWAIAKKIADHTLAVGWDKRYGGVYDHGGRSSGPSSPEG